jgi:hypothetical protein
MPATIKINRFSTFIDRSIIMKSDIGLADATASAVNLSINLADVWIRMVLSPGFIWNEAHL